jgi:RNA polymerase sigma-70 factor, ECF subfamily
VAHPAASRFTPTDMSVPEAVLVRRLQEHDEDAYVEIIRLYQHKVFNLIYRMIGNREEAEDIAQDVFITVFKSVDTFRGESKFSTWLYRIAANHCKNRMKYLGRRHHKDTGVLDEEAERAMASSQPSATTPHIDGPDRVLEGLQLEKLVQEGIALLDEEHRMLVVLRDVEDLSYQEISTITGLPEGTVKSRLHRARMALKEHLAKHLG